MSFLNKLELLNSKPLHVRTENITTGKNISLRIVFLSDIHLKGFNDQKLIENIIHTTQECRPEIILIGGDMVDRKIALLNLFQLIEQLKKICPIYIVSGNHDAWVGITEVLNCVKKAGAHCINNSYALIKSNSQIVIIEGNQCKTHFKDSYRICLAHHPNDFYKVSDSGVDMMFSGHLHGCQIVTHTQNNLLYPGAWFYKWNGLKFKHNQSTLIVSRGLNDTLSIRWNCPREVIVCQLN